MILGTSLGRHIKKMYFLMKQGCEFTVLVHKNILISTNKKSVS